MAVKIAVEEGRVSVEPLWRVGSRKLGKPKGTGVVHEGQFYFSTSKRRKKGLTTAIFELGSGRELAERVLVSGNLTGLVQAGRHLFGLVSTRAGLGEGYVYDLAGKEVAVNRLSGPLLEGDRLQKVRAESGTELWGDYRYNGHFHAVPFFHGSRIYIRSRDELLCVGVK